MSKESYNINLYNLLMTGSIEDIKKNLLTEIYNVGYYCSRTVGEGYFSKVYDPIGSVTNIGDNKFMKTVVKEAKNVNGKIYYDDIEDYLIISCDHAMTVEAIMLFILSKSWYKGQNIHLPFMAGFGCCNTNDPRIVTNIILEQYGLSKNIDTIDSHDKYISQPNIHLTHTQLIKPYLVTINDLFEYLCVYHDEKYMCKLPNGEIVYVPEIFDNFVIFYLHTSYFVWINFKMILGDQHLNNMYVQWLYKNSICGKVDISEIEHIYYEIDKNKYIKTNTHKINFKIGDIGQSIMNVQPKVILVGDLSYNDILNRIIEIKDKYKTYYDILHNIFGSVPFGIIKETKYFKYLNSDNILMSSYVPFVGFSREIYDKVPSQIDILNSDIWEHVEKKENGSKNFVNYLHV